MNKDNYLEFWLKLKPLLSKLTKVKTFYDKDSNMLLFICGRDYPDKWCDLIWNSCEKVGIPYNNIDISAENSITKTSTRL